MAKPWPYRMVHCAAFWGAAALLCVFALCHAARAADDLDARRQQIRDMPPSEQQDLLRRQERFLALPLDEQNRLRALQAAIDEDENSARLEETLKRYHEWLKTLTPTQRAELADATPEERLKLIKRLKTQQQIARQQQHLAELLTRKDLAEILKWTEDVIWENRESILADMSTNRRKGLEKMSVSQQRRALVGYAFERARRGRRGALTPATQADIDKLAGKLSETARAELGQAEGLEAQRKMVRGWVGMAMHQMESWQLARRLAPLVGEEVVQFVQQDLKPSERERLLGMSPEKMREEVRKLYVDHQRANADWNLEDRAVNRLPDRGKGPDRGKNNFRKGPPRQPPVDPATK